MSPKNPPITAGLAASGLLWLATTVASGQTGPTLRGLPNAPASTPSTQLVLLMSNGTVVRGEITDDPQAGVYRLKCKGGQVPYPKTSVKRAAGSLEEIYQYLVASLPPGDPDERMKLVRWCLTEHLTAQAREQLAAVLDICPNDPQATLMAKNMDNNAERAARVDPDVRQTSGEMPRADAPADLDPRIVTKVRNRFGRDALPEIFDLPPAMAIRRASEFAERVQPVLQQSCAGCHNERYQGEFQLVQIKSPRRDLRNPDIARANLDAALRLVNRDDPSRSALLSAGLVPHANKPGSIFKGANDPSYYVLATWVRSLKPPGKAPSTGDPVARGNRFPAPTEAAPGEGFAADRVGRSSPTAIGQPPRGLPALPGADVLATARVNPPPQPKGVYNKYEESADFSGYADSEFAAPYAAGGPPPRRPAAAPARRPAPLGKNEPNDDPEPAEVEQTTGKLVAPGVVAIEPTDDPRKLPGMNKSLYPSATKGDPARKKKAQVDPALLEQMIKNRNGNP